MRVALFTDGITPYVVGGIQRHSFYLCKYLAQKGIKVDLYHTSNSKDYDPNKLEFFTEEEKKNITSHLIPFPKHKRFPGHYVRESFEYSARIYKEFVKHAEGVDFVYSKNYCSWKFLNEKEKGVKLPPIGVKLHGYELFQYYHGLKDNFFVLQHKKPTIYNTQKADYVFSYGKGITKIITENIKVSNDRIIEIPTGISSEWLNEELNIDNNKGINFVFIGRYTKRKGIHYIHKFIRENPELNCTFNFIGPIPNEEKIEGGNLIYHGQITDVERIKSIVDESEVLLCPSFSEGMPNVIMEGMARGCAVLATDVGAVSEMVDDDNGWMIQAGKYNEFEIKMKEILSLDKRVIEQKRNNSISKVKNGFLWENVAELVIEEIEKIIERK